MNRPKALNALTHAMIEPIRGALETWQHDSAIELVIIDGAGERGFCAGGDVRTLYESRVHGSAYARTFWRDEYRLNAYIGRYPKPFVAIQDGIVMGGGIGLSAHGRHRIVTERSQLAMPETGIGLIPDVGGTWILAHAPGETGVYLGLTSERMQAADAIYARFSDAFVPSHKLATLTGQLCEARATEVAACIGSVAEDPGKSELAALSPVVDAIFAGDTMEGILDRLIADSGAWAEDMHAKLREKSPKSMKLTLAAIRNARSLASLEEALNVEFRLCTRLFEDGEFPEGVRALIIDKDRQPKWSPPELSAFGTDAVKSYLAPLPAGEELGLTPTG
jgi:enoyl-CoA hydratase